MNKIRAFIHKYGIIFHVATLIFWIYLLKVNYDEFQVTPTIPTKIAVISAIVLIFLSSFNLVMAIRRLKKQN